MKISRRYLSMILGAVSVILAGFVVAVAARSRPGGTQDDSLFEMDMRFDVDLGRLLAWVIFVMAMIGAVLVAMGLKQTKRREDRRKRGLLGTVIGVIVFLLVLRAVQPLADTLLNTGEAVAREDPEGGTSVLSGGSAAWLFSLLLAALVAAALTRVGLTVRDGPASFDAEVAPAEHIPTSPSPSNRRQTLLGSDPRSRVLAAYDGFEQSATSREIPRGRNETAARHARRTARELSLGEADVESLMGRYSDSRFGDREVTEGEAESAESLSARLKKEMGT